MPHRRATPGRRLVRSILKAGVGGSLLVTAIATPASAGAPQQGSREGDSRPAVARFRVTEGTWMSLDVSPDGRTIVFDLLGQLYALPIEGGTARQLTTGTAWHQQPRYSPDGRSLAFISDRSGVSNLWVMSSDGTRARRLSNLLPANSGSGIISPAWSPDGRQVVVSQKLQAVSRWAPAPAQDWAWLLASYEVESGRMRWVSDTSAEHLQSALGPAFAPDGRLYAAVKPFSTIVDLGLPVRVMRVDLETGATHPESPIEAYHSALRPAVSPNGRHLMYASSTGSRFGLRLRDLSTDDERWLVEEALDLPPMHEGIWADMIPAYAFTPDSKAIVAAYGGRIHRVELQTGRQTVVPFEATVERELLPGSTHQFALPDTASRTTSVNHAALSPDGRRVAFSALDRIWTMDLPEDGSKPAAPRRLTDGSAGEFYPSWFPDGRAIAYSTWADGEGGGVWIAAVPSSGRAGPSWPQRLVKDTALYFNTAVSPDGKSVAVIRSPLPPERVLVHSHHEPPREPALVLVPVDRSPARTVTSLVRVAEEGKRRPFEQLYFTSSPERVFVGLASWSPDGSRLPDALQVRPADGRPASVTAVLSPDRRRALVVRRSTLYEVGGPDGKPLAGDTIALTAANRRPGYALAPWMSWSADGRRSLVVQGGTLLLTDRRPDGAVEVTRVDVPLTLQPDRPQGTIVLHGARLVTMRGDEVIPQGDIVVTGNRIARVGASADRQAGRPACVVDLSGKTIIPGYVDVHDHIALPQGVHPGQCWQCMLRLAYGVTASRDNWPDPSFYNDIFTYRERERTGELIGPRLFTTGIAYFGADPPLTTEQQALDVVQPYADYFETETFKDYDGRSSRRADQLLAGALARVGLNGTSHITTLQEALTIAIDGFSGVEHAPPIETFADVAMLLSRSRVTYTHTYALTDHGYAIRRHGEPWSHARMRRFVPPSARSWAWPPWTVDEVGSPREKSVVTGHTAGAARLAAAGGKVAMGSHGDVPGIGFHHEMWLHAVGGMPAHEILRSATIVGATAIGHGNDFGSLEPGKLADLQVIDGNPLEVIHHTTGILYVMKNGRLYRAEDLTKVWPRRQPLAAGYLWDDSGKSPIRSPAVIPPCRS